MEPIVVTYTPADASSRAVLMTIKELHLHVKLVQTDNEKHSQDIKTPTSSSRRSIPSIDDNGYKLSESHAILMYLSDRYNMNETIYPKDPQKRGLVNYWLVFELETLSRAIEDYTSHTDHEAPDKDTENVMRKLFDFMENSLVRKYYITGPHMTIADIAISASMSALDAVKYDISSWDNLSSYVKRMKNLPCYQECNEPGLENGNSEIMENQNDSTSLNE